MYCVVTMSNFTYRTLWTSTTSPNQMQPRLSFLGTTTSTPKLRSPTAVRDLFIQSARVDANEISKEVPPANKSCQHNDLTSPDTRMEFKRRIGPAGGFNPYLANIGQLGENTENQRAQEIVGSPLSDPGR